MSRRRVKKYGTMVISLMILRLLFDHRSQSYGLRPVIAGFSRSLRKCLPDTFLPSRRSGWPFILILNRRLS